VIQAGLAGGQASFFNPVEKRSSASNAGYRPSSLK
jgi:hypothetical protein